jgi:N6-L-threonylcarbamoyladenine synthase
MKIFAAESSCDETAIALFDTNAEQEDQLVAHTLFSQISQHQPYGGVVPEIASRDHIRKIRLLSEQAFTQASWVPQDIDFFACTTGPGLSGALLVGTAFTHAMAWSFQKPVIPIHHLEGHLASVFLGKNNITFPFMALLVSGGHTQLYKVNAPCQYDLLGETLDDAAGEAFDKTAKLLGLPYPGGALLSELAQKGEATFDLPRPLLHSDLTFSFSGLKTAVATLVQQQKNNWTETLRANVARSFVEAVIDVLVHKSLKAMKQEKIKQLVVVGGVSANQQLRESLQDKVDLIKGSVYFPPLSWCTDNAAMIAQAAAWRLEYKQTKATQPAGNFSVFPRWDLLSY